MKLKPFFKFYGGKWRATNLYPEPRHNTLIEPFAGSAGYALNYAHLDVKLYDVDPIIVGIWDFLIHASMSDIMDLPDLEMGQDVQQLAACWWLRRQENRDAAAFEKHVQARRALERINEGSRT